MTLISFCFADQRAEGRLHRLDNMFLLNSEQEMFAPICQDPMPMTDDMLQEQSDILSHLGTSREATALRVKMQLPSLISDISAFKAANPAASFEDFVRWYSPRDYDDDAGLSPRMQSEDNTWMEAWNSATSVPVARQKKLFDYTKEGEKVFHFLASLSLSSLMQHCLPIILHSAVSQLFREYHVLGLDAVAPSDEKSLTGSNFNAIRKLEQMILTFKSLERKWEQVKQHRQHASVDLDEEDMKHFNWDLCSKGQATVTTMAQRRLILDLIRLKKKHETDELDAGERLTIEDRSDASLLQPPSVKEFVLRVDLPRPALYSRSLPQRMNCLLSDNEFRIASSLSEDTSFS